MTNLNPVGKTGLLVAAMRANESKRTQEQGRLFTDPFAEKLAGEEGFRILAEAIAIVGEQPAIAIRTRYIDDRMKAALVSGVRQIVILAAGMDARAFRLDFPPGTKLFEIDRPEVLHYKHQILENAGPKCSRITIAADLKDDPWENRLLENGMDPKVRTLWLVEGLVMYLKEEDVISIFKKITTLSTKDSLFLCDVLGRTLLDSPFMKAQLEYLEKLGAPWYFGTDEPEKFFATWGWKSTAVTAGEVAPDRWPFPTAPRNIPNVPRGFYVEGINLGT